MEVRKLVNNRDDGGLGDKNHGLARSPYGLVAATCWVYLYPLPHPPAPRPSNNLPPSPFSPSLISLTVSVDVKHRVYLLTSHSPLGYIRGKFCGDSTNVLRVSL